MEVEVLPSHIIVHAGTNDLSVQPSHNCVKNIENLALCIKKKLTDSRIAISSITVRNDLDLSKQISTANDELQESALRTGLILLKTIILIEGFESRLKHFILTIVLPD